jgi:hypothetical protein
MTAFRPPTASGGRRPRTLRAIAWAAALTTGVATVLAASGLVAAPAQAAAHRIALRVLVVTDNGPGASALAHELDLEGVPYTTVDVTAAGRPTIDAAFLDDGTTAKYQAVVLPNEAGGGLAATELAALATYEAAYGVRQVDAFTFPGGTVDGTSPSYSGSVDGTTATLTAAARADGFGYLRGPVTIENVDPNTSETFGYLAVPVSPLPAGHTWTPFLTASVGAATGSLAYVWGHDGREELVVAASFNQNMQWYNAVAEGLVGWLTHGVHLGYNRNYLAVQIDDVFLADSRWSVDGNCTPGDNCVDPAVTTPDIRMTPADVTRLTGWQAQNGVRLDLVFNAAGAGTVAAPDPTTDALLAAKAQFRWINHTWSHQFLGCIQIAPTVQGGTWHCATSATETPRMDPEIPGTLSGGVYWASQAAITSQVADDTAYALANQLPGFDPAELVTGEHSGLLTAPQQPVDNPFLAPALASLGIRYTASDASREPGARFVQGSTTTSTVPRHPMNIFYNAGTYRDEVDEYNWIYTSAANGGSDICTQNPATSTCITPLPAADAAQAKASFEGYIQPIEVRNALRFVLSNDPRPFYAHQSNLAEDGILYPVLAGVAATYATTVDTATTPLVQTGLTGQSQALARMDAWTATSRSAAFTDGWLDTTGVHLPASSVAVPVTVPAGSSGTGLEPYAGSLSGWVGGGTAVTTPPTGYVLAPVPTAPTAPTGVTAVAGSTVATVSWAAPASDGGSAVTGYVVRRYTGTSTTPSATYTAAGGATSLVVSGLNNGTGYRFDVAAVNAVGTGPASVLTASVTPRSTLAPVPTSVAGLAGNASATVTWTPPTDTSGVTGYRVRAYVGTSTSVARTVTVGLGRTVAAVSGLTNGTAYTFTVNAVTGNANGLDSPRSAAVTPNLRAQTDVAPTIGAVTPGNGSLVVTFAPPVELAGTTPTGYRVRAYLAGTTLLARSVTVGATAGSATVTGLLNGIAYDVQVTVQTAAGTGPASARSAAASPRPTVPSAPAIGTAGSGSAGGAVTATARWSSPSTSGGSAVNGYVVTATQYDAGGAVIGTTTSPVVSLFQRSYTMTLPAVGQYRFTVVARNAVGTSAPSAASNLVTGQ